MTVSVWGVEHGDEVSKRRDRGASSGNASAGRLIAGGVFSPIHGAVAGRKGAKLKASGSQWAGAATGALAGAAVSRGKYAGPGAILGGAGATQYGNKKGWYKSQGTVVKKSVWGVQHEVSKKDYDKSDLNFRKQGMAYKDKAARKRVSQEARRESGFYSKNSPNKKENWKTVGRSAGVGAGAGALAGTAIGAATRKPMGALIGGAAGGEIGLYGGAVHGQVKVANRGLATAFKNGKKRGDIVPKNYTRKKLSPVND